MSFEIEDQVTRDMGSRARLALDALDVAIWTRSAEIISEAEDLLRDGNLNSERALPLLISLVEQRNIASNLQSQVREGIKAVHRINRKADDIADAETATERIKSRGRNRFVRSKAGNPSGS